MEGVGGTRVKGVGALGLERVGAGALGDERVGGQGHWEMRGWGAVALGVEGVGA